MFSMFDVADSVKCQRPELVLADVWIEPELCHGVRLHVQGDKFFLLAHWSKP